MPFGPTNGPATFINFIHNIDSIWKKPAKQRGITIDNNTNTKIIVNNIVSWAKLINFVLAYIECQLKVWQVYRLSLNLCKSHIFLEWFKFVGIDMCDDRNSPVQSKHTFPQNSLKHCQIHQLFSVLLQIHS